MAANLPLTAGGAWGNVTSGVWSQTAWPEDTLTLMLAPAGGQAIVFERKP